MDELWIRSKLQIAKDDDWFALSIDERQRWLAYARRRRQHLTTLPQELSATARAQDLSIDQVTYVALLRLAQEL